MTICIRQSLAALAIGLTLTTSAMSSGNGEFRGGRGRVMLERFIFESGGERTVGNLFLPAGKRIGFVVTTSPETSVKEQAAGAYASIVHKSLRAFSPER